LHLFEGYGIELEYAIVDRETLEVRPFADRVLAAAAGEIVSDVERGPTAWSNELVAHQIEIKTNGPVARLESVPEAFHAATRSICSFLEAEDARLMPTGMHPWMDPAREAVLWPHEYHEVYSCYDRIFDCRSHGWANVQAMHLNLPFADDLEFERLNAAVRIALPILPALAASSPFVDARLGGWMDERLRAYRDHCKRIPSLTGRVIPEPVWTREAYESRILAPIWRDLAAHDPDGLLAEPFAAARGAIARFDRHAIEIRVLDAQECAAMDLAIAAAASALVRALVEERWVDRARQQAFETERLAPILWAVAEGADHALVADRGYLECLGLGGRASARRRLWGELLERLDWASDGGASPWREALEILVDEGPLARRIVRALGEKPSRAELFDVYGTLCDRLEEGRPFRARE
jgi:gamma-glutamyl:cysteine ligase YbdK (ATP-grasp superfamily)